MRRATEGPVNESWNLFIISRAISATFSAASRRSRASKDWGRFLANEFKQFIGKEMRLSQVEYAPKVDSQQILTFYMGKNTPERKDYIMENLVVAVEE